jgi:hypothetical protein
MKTIFILALTSLVLAGCGEPNPRFKPGDRVRVKGIDKEVFIRFYSISSEGYAVQYTNSLGEIKHGSYSSWELEEYGGR